jgi:hypothetical protein
MSSSPAPKINRVPCRLHFLPSGERSSVITAHRVFRHGNTEKKDYKICIAVFTAMQKDSRLRVDSFQIPKVMQFAYSFSLRRTGLLR